MTRILGISGSLRAGSFNTALLRAAQATTADGVELEIATLHGIPLYDGDAEARDGEPETGFAAQDFMDAAVAACPSEAASVLVHNGDQYAAQAVPA